MARLKHLAELNTWDLATDPARYTFESMQIAAQIRGIPVVFTKRLQARLLDNYLKNQTLVAESKWFAQQHQVAPDVLAAASMAQKLQDQLLLHRTQMQATDEESRQLARRYQELSRAERRLFDDMQREHEKLVAAKSDCLKQLGEEDEMPAVTAATAAAQLRVYNKRLKAIELETLRLCGGESEHRATIKGRAEEDGSRSSLNSHFGAIQTPHSKEEEPCMCGGGETRRAEL